MNLLGLTITQKVMLGTALLGCVAGVIGSFAVLRRRALVGDMLSHAALPGICLAFLLMGRRNLLGLMLGAFVAGVAGIAVMTLVRRWTRTREDAAIGIVLSTFFGAGIVLLTIISRMPIGGKAGLESFLFGAAATMRNADIAIIAGFSISCLLILLLFYKEFKVYSFDPEFAVAQGWPGLTLDLLMMGTLTAVTIVGLPAVGVVLMAAMIIMPCATARFWTNRLGVLLTLSGVIGLLMGSVGTLVSIQQKLPPGPVIVLTGTLLFVVSLLFAPARGVLMSMWRSLRLRHKMARRNLLRTLYELSETALPERPIVSTAQILHVRSWNSVQLNRMLRHAAREGLVVTTPEGVQLTPAGLKEAAAVTRRHRLWELYLIEGANVAPERSERDADSIEHYLSPEITRILEARLAQAGRLPVTADVLQSPHDTGTAPASQEVSHG